MVKPTYNEVKTQIKDVRDNIIITQRRIDLCDSAYELINLSLELENYETELMILEDYMERTIARGRR